MINRINFQQTRLIERIDEILHPKVRARLDADWAGVFRNVFLQMMPVDDIGKSFSMDFGRPTKEHYSICGLILLQEYFGWTVEETVKHYLYDLEIHYALRKVHFVRRLIVQLLMMPLCIVELENTA